jgi:hypothetical protein
MLYIKYGGDAEIEQEVVVRMHATSVPNLFVATLRFEHVCNVVDPQAQS